LYPHERKGIPLGRSDVLKGEDWIIRALGARESAWA